MRKILLLLILFVFLILSCRSINNTRDELGIAYNKVMFSFDDCPDEDTTPLLLDLLERYEIKALFCLLGVNAEQYQGLVKRIHDEGHVIINHGYYDKHAYSMDEKEFTDNLLRGEKAISSALGFAMNPKLYRPHGGYYKPMHERTLIGSGYSLISANIRVYDAVKTSKNRRQAANQIIKKVIKNSGGMIILHDARGIYSRKEIELKKNPEGPFNRLWIVDVVDDVIVSLLDKGFILHHPDLLTAAGFGD